MLIISVILFIIGIFLIYDSISSLRNTHKINTNIDNENNRLYNQNNELKQKFNELQNNINKSKEQLNDIQNNISKTLDNQKELSQKAFENYCDVLEKQYEEQEAEYEQYKDALETSYSNRQIELMRELDQIKTDLDKIKATRAAAIQAQLKEKEIEENSAFYCLQVSEPELRDIAVLESIKPKLNQPRILSMLIWQTFFRTPMTNLCNNVIGKADKTGIYKITNIKTKECYIGQAVNLSDRWKQHAKAGLGIDTPQGNKLYRAMQEFGIQNFSWEVIEECPRADLDEKEKYYIKLYQSKEYGYNTLKGVN